MTTDRTCRACNMLTSDFRAGRNVCRSCERAKHRAWHHANRETQLALMRQRNPAYYQTRRTELIARAQAYNQNHPDMRRRVGKQNKSRQRDKLSACYVRRILAESMRVPCADVPSPLVAVQTELLKLKRELRA